MSSSKTSRSKRSAVYGLPTFWGVIMFALVGCALWFSIFAQSPVDRWIAFLMIILILLHLAESNNPFRSLEFTVLPFEPPFENETSHLTIEAVNPTEFPSDGLEFRLRGQTNWITLSELPANSSRQLKISMSPLARGRHSLPTLNVKTYPSTRLFRLWKVLKTGAEFLVLPAAKDHTVSYAQFEPKRDESELSHIESIVDERLMYKMDHKLFLKTGKAYYRKSEASQSSPSIHFDWALLDRLSERDREEQFSNWIKELQTNTEFPSTSSASKVFTSMSAGNRRSLPMETVIRITTPFVTAQSTAGAMNWHSLKEKYAEWIYVKD